jgi:multidrug efflux pump subunit AcrB
MNPIVFALRRPVTIIVAAVALVLGSILALTRTRIDIFPELNLPVIYVAQPYGGMDSAQMEGLLTNYYEYHFLYISGIHHVESKNIQSVALMKLYFHPGTDMAQAMAETINYVNRSRAFMPTGTVSPFVMRFDTGSVPIGYLVLSSKDPNRTIGEMQRRALFDVRPIFATLPGVSAPPPFGGSQRTIVFKTDPKKMDSAGVSLRDVITAVADGNSISPSGNVYIQDKMPIVRINSVPRDPQELGNIPVRPGSPVCLRNIGEVKDATDIPTGYALVNGQRLDAVGNQRGQEEPAAHAESAPRGHRHQFGVRSVALCHARDVGRRGGGNSGRMPHRPDGAGVPPRLAQRDRRRPQHPSGPAGIGRRSLAVGADTQPDDAGRAGARRGNPRG